MGRRKPDGYELAAHLWKSDKAGLPNFDPLVSLPLKERVAQ